MEDAAADSRPCVLVTGAAGFVGAHVAKAVHDRGTFRVCGTVRSKDRDGPELTKICPGIELLELDLLRNSDADWLLALKTLRVKFCLHVASPFFWEQSADPEEALIKPAQVGTQRVMDACVASRCVQRVIITASTSCMTFGWDCHKLAEKNIAMGPELWTNLDEKTQELKVPDYPRSKTLAERLAWTYSDRIEVCTVCPVVTFGPLLVPKPCESGALVKEIGKLLVVPGANFGLQVVDVRDVAEMHVLAIEKAEAVGNRFICYSAYLTFVELADAVRTAMEEEGRSAFCPSRSRQSCANQHSGSNGVVDQVRQDSMPRPEERSLAPSVRRLPLLAPKWLLKLNALVDRKIFLLMLTDGIDRLKVDTSNAARLLDKRTYLDAKSSVYAMAKSLIRRGMINI